MRSLMQFVKWLSAAIVAGAMLFAVPVVLVIAPSPLDSERGITALVRALIEDTQVFDESVVSVLVALGWALWVYMTAVFLLEAVSAAVGVASRNIRGLSFGQSVARPLVAALMWSSTASTVALSVIGAGGVVAMTTEVAHAQDAAVNGASSFDIALRQGHVYVMNDDAEESTDPTGPIVTDQGDGTLVVDGQVVRPHLVVIKDDTMWDLAERHLNDPFRWVEIAELNLGRPQQYSPVVTDPDLIWPGTLLYMPGDAVGLNTPPPGVVEAPAVVEVEEEADLPEEVDCGPVLQFGGPATNRAAPEITEETMAVPPEAERVETSGRDEFGLSGDFPWWLAAAGVAAAGVFTAGLMHRIAKRRDRDHALGGAVEESAELEELLEDLAEPEPELRTHLLAAAASLRAEMTETDAPMMQVDADQTTAVFTQVIRPAEESPWTYSGDDGERAVWALPHSDSPSVPDGGSPLYGVGDNVFLNLEAIGWLGLEGVEDMVAGHLRHLVHDLVGNFGQEHDIVLRVGGPGMVDGAEVYGSATAADVSAMRGELAEYTRQADMAHAELGSSLAGQLREADGDWPTLVLLVDLAECDALDELLTPIHSFPGRYPIAVISVGVSSGAPWTGHIESANEMSIESVYLNKAPRVRPQLMSASTAEALAAQLRSQLSTKRWETAEPSTEPEPIATDAVEPDWVEAQVESSFDNADTERAERRVTEEPGLVNPVMGKIIPNGKSQDDPIAEPVEGPAESEMLQHPFGSGRAPSANGKRCDLADVINPRFTPNRLAQFRDFSPVSDDDEWSDADDEVDEVMATKDSGLPQLRLLGRPEMGGTNGDLRERALATATLLALSGDGLERKQIRHRIWGGRDVDMRQVRNVLAELQVTLGTCVRREGKLVSIAVDTDIDEVERRIGRCASLPWRTAAALITETLEFFRGAPFQGISSECWNWVDDEGAQTRRRILARAEAALAEAADLAEAAEAWTLVREVGETGLRINPLSQAMATHAAIGSAMTGDTSGAISLVAAWESDFEATFSEDPPSDLRAAILRVVDTRVA